MPLLSRGTGDGGLLACPGDCRNARTCRSSAGQTSLRVQVPARHRRPVGGRAVAVAEAVGDFVVWRRDGLPAYHLASVVEDRDLGVTAHRPRRGPHRVASAAQVLLASGLDAATVAQAVYVHHTLVAEPEGVKLSKSQISTGPMDLTAALRDEVRRIATVIGEACGIGPAG